LKLLFKILFLYLLSKGALAGSCCGGGGGTAQIMLGESKSVFRSSYQNQTILAESDSYSQIIPKVSNELETIKTTSFSASYRLSHLWQSGLSIPVISKTKYISNEWTEVQGMGDIKINSAYEFWPEYSRNQFVTQSFIIFQLTIPTAPSLFTTKRKDVLDTRGQGHYIYSIGNMSIKKFKNQSFSLGATISYREPKSFTNSLFSKQSIQTQSSLNNELSASHSYNLTKNLSSTLQLSRVYEDNVTTSVFIGKIQSSLVYTSSIGLNYSFDDWDISTSYKDDFLVGPSHNHTLSKAISIGLIKRTSL
jgi:hypothetical protein